MDIEIGALPEGLSWPEDVEETVRLAAETVGELYDAGSCEVSVTLTDNAHIRELNRDYRGIDRPTDVLSFALRESEEPEVEGEAGAEALGDIIISLERAAEQADEYGHSLRREVAFLTVHGMLHLLGYDHIEEEEREEMEREQCFVMERLGIPRE